MSQPEPSSSSRGKSRRDGGKQSLYRPTRDERDRSGYSSGYRGKNRPSSNVDAAPPTILLKTRANDTRSLSPVQQVKPSVSLASGENVSRDAFKVHARKDVLDNTAVPSMPTPVKFLSEDLVFQDSLHDFLTDNCEFLVVGCVGLQWSGKSSVLSHLASSKYKITPY